MTTKTFEDSPEAEELDLLRHKIVEMSFDECKMDVAKLLGKMQTIYFDWIDRLIVESREFLIEQPEGEIIAVEDPNHSNVIYANFGYQEKVVDIMEEAGQIFSDEPEPPKKDEE